MSDEPDVANEKSWLDRLGPRAQRRGTPRFGITIAAAGSALVVVGAVVLGGEQLPGGSDGSDFVDQLPGAVLCGAVVVAGYLVLARTRTGPLATAGVAASVLAVPPFVFFLSSSDSDVSTDAVLGVSTAVWLVSYFVGPGRSRLPYLGAGLAGAWLFVVDQVGPPVGLLPFAFLFPDQMVVSTTGRAIPDSFAPGPSAFGFPSVTDVAAVSLLFGLAYLVVARILDRRGYGGAATPFTFVGVIALFAGVVGFANELELAGTGLALMAAGGAVVAHGAATGRRLTNWAGGVAVAAGAIALIGDIVGDIDDEQVTAFGIGVIVAGISLVLAAHAAARSVREPDDIDPTPSFGRTPNSGVDPVG